MKGMVKYLIGLVVCYAIAVGVGYATNPEAESIISVLTDTTTLIIFAAIVGLCLLVILAKKFKGSSGANASGVGTTKSGEKLDQYFDARWIKEGELLREQRFMPCVFGSTLGKMKDGIVIRNLLKGGKLNINMYKPIHTMIIGTTGSGKTQLYISPSVRILSKTATKPCMVITDPKGELFNEHSIQLKESGYRLMVLDLRNPYASTRWNPMDNAYTQYHRAVEMAKEVKVHKNEKVTETKLQMTAAPKDYGDTWYEFSKNAYPSQEALQEDLKAKAQELKDLSENELREIASSIVPIESKTDSSWERGAQDFLYGLMIAMLEDSLDPELGMTREKFNFYNLAKIATFKDADADNPFGTLRNYCGNRSKFSKVGSLTSTAINNAPNTTRSYMGVLNARISIFQDAGICYCTSYNDMYFDDFSDQPTVLFIKVPDEKESRHCIATMCISQLYKKLIEKASETKNLKLKRNVYFLLDEFANLPKIDKMDSLITVGRSRGIFFSLVVQSYSQLDNKYGKECADTIKGNCNIQIFIGTEDQKTREEFSKMCGDVSIETHTASQSRNESREDGSSTTTNAQRVTRPLIYPYELGQLEKNNVIVKIFQEHPIKTPCTPFYANTCFDKRIAKDVYAPSKALDEEKIYYDIKLRNKKAMRGSGGLDDFDF